MFERTVVEAAEWLGFAGGLCIVWACAVEKWGVAVDSLVRLGRRCAIATLSGWKPSGLDVSRGLNPLTNFA